MFKYNINWENFVLEILEKIGGDINKILFSYEGKKETIEHIEKYIKKGKVLDCSCNIVRWLKLLKNFDSNK